MRRQINMVTEAHRSWTVSMCSPLQRQANGSSVERNSQSIYSVCRGPQSPSQHLTPHFRAVQRPNTTNVTCHRKTEERKAPSKPQQCQTVVCTSTPHSHQKLSVLRAKQEGSKPKPVVSIWPKKHSLLPTDLTAGLNTVDIGTGSQIHLVTSHVFSLATHSPVLP